MKELGLVPVTTLTVESGRAYQVVAKKGKSSLGISLGANMSVKKTPLVVLEVRFLQSGDDLFSKFGPLRSPEGHLCKMKIPMFHPACRGEGLEEAFKAAKIGESLYEWVKTRVKEDGGKMVLGVDFFDETLNLIFSRSFEEEKPEIFFKLPEKI